MNTKKDIPPNDISPFAKEKLAKEIVKNNTIFALGEQNKNTKITNTKVKLDEEFKKTYGASGALKSQTGGTIRTVVIANAEIIKNILENMLKQPEKNFENDGREQI